MTFVGLLGSFISAQSGLQRYVGYTGLYLLIVVAAVAMGEILRSHLWQVLAVGIVSIMVFSAIGMHDPALSPQFYPNIQTATRAKTADYNEAIQIYNILPSAPFIVSNYPFSVSLGYINAVNSSKTLEFIGSLKNGRNAITELENGSSPPPNTFYIWSPDLLSIANESYINVVYSGYYVAVEGNHR
jgi:hypothetical protein